MLANASPTFLLASHEAALLADLESVLLSSGARVEIVFSADAALASMIAPRPLSLALLDVNLPGMEISELLRAVRVLVSSKRLPIVLISDTVTQEWASRLAEGMIDDLIPRTAELSYWQLRLDQVRRRQRYQREIDTLREGAMLNAQMDHLTGVYNRETMLSMLFRESDIAQRMNSSLCIILFDIDDFGHWNSRLGANACDELLCQIVGRTSRLLRTYDLLGRPGMDEFLIPFRAVAPRMLACWRSGFAPRFFCSPFHVGAESIRLSACIGIATSQGRSPMVVLREAEKALQIAKNAGPESIQCFNNCTQTRAAPFAFLSPTSGDELLAW